MNHEKDSRPLFSDLLDAIRADDCSRIDRLVRQDDSLLRAASPLGLTPLHAAAAYWQIAPADYFLRRGLDVNARSARGHTPLHLAAIERSPLELVQLLIGRGADPDILDEAGRTALHHASLAGRFEVSRFLAPLTGRIDLLPAVCSDRLDLASRMLAENAGAAFDLQDGDMTLLHWAGWAGLTPQMVDLLLEHDADINARAEDDTTPLHWAAGFRDFQRVDLCDRNELVESFNREAGRWLDIPPRFPTEAIERTVRQTVESLSPNDVRTPYLMKNLQQGVNGIVAWYRRRDQESRLISQPAPPEHVEAVRRLIAAGAEVQAEAGRSALQTPLHWAAAAGHAAIVQALVEAGANVESADEDGKTALYLAGDLQHWEVVEFLLAHGARTTTYLNYTPLHFATQFDLEEMAKLLIADGADLNSRSDLDDTPLMLAASEHYWGVARLLIDAGADVNIPGRDGTTPLHTAAGDGNSQLVAKLLAHGADVHACGFTGETALHAAYCCPEVIDLLLAVGLDIDARNSKGQTLLHSACAYMQDDEFDHESVVQALLARGADINARDDNAHTPLGLALEDGNRLAADTLRRLGGMK